MNDFEEERIGPKEISPDEISESQLTELIHQYIIPDGSDFAMTSDQFDAKERLARKQIASGSLKIIYDISSDSTTLMTSQDWRQLRPK